MLLYRFTILGAVQEQCNCLPHYSRLSQMLLHHLITLKILRGLPCKPHICCSHISACFEACESILHLSLAPFRSTSKVFSSRKESSSLKRAHSLHLCWTKQGGSIPEYLVFNALWHKSLCAVDTGLSGWAISMQINWSCEGLLVLIRKCSFEWEIGWYQVNVWLCLLRWMLCAEKGWKIADMLLAYIRWLVSGGCKQCGKATWRVAQEGWEGGGGRGTE